VCHRRACSPDTRPANARFRPAEHDDHLLRAIAASVPSKDVI
jgi:hypothetical protein